MPRRLIGFPVKKFFNSRLPSEWLGQSRRWSCRTAGVLRFLPALPDSWPAGSMTGLRTRGGFEVDIVWSGGRLAHGRIFSHRGGFAGSVHFPTVVCQKCGLVENANAT